MCSHPHQEATPQFRFESKLLTTTYAVCAAVLFGWATGVHAQADFPNRPVRMVNPYTPGGSVDLVGRAVAAGLSEIWGQQVIVDNRPGAGTMIGTELVVRAEPDGYTMLCTSSTIAILTSMYKNMRFDPGRDLSAVALAALSPFMLVVNAGVPAKSVQELIALAKSQPGKITGASSGVG
ncbi:MAG: Bug family tripartite tricarboxylate transporter substrate binding protein, partial [Burkholderiales bacterium]